MKRSINCLKYLHQPKNLKPFFSYEKGRYWDVGQGKIAFEFEHERTGFVHEQMDIAFETSTKGQCSTVKGGTWPESTESEDCWVQKQQSDRLGIMRGLCT